MALVCRTAALLAGIFLLTGCAQKQEETSSTTPDPNDRVSTIPWNRPQSWEGQGMMPGFQGSY